MATINMPAIFASAYPKSAWGFAQDGQNSHYERVGKALGFTENEVSILVHANDAGLSFQTIATLIEEHPPVLSSAMTEIRKAEEIAFVRNVTAAIQHGQKSKKHFSYSKYPNAAAFSGIDLLPMNAPAMYPWKSYDESLLIKEAYMGKHSWKKQQAHDDKIMSMQMLVESMKKTLISPDIFADWVDDADFYNPYKGIAKTGAGSFASWTGHNSDLTPKPGELAKLLGIWTPK